MIVYEWTPQVLAEIKELKSFFVAPDTWMSIEQKRELISIHYKPTQFDDEDTVDRSHPFEGGRVWDVGKWFQL